MNPFFLYPDSENLKSRSEGHTQADSEPVHSINEGSEFLNDAIRMNDLPLMFSEEKIDTGRRRNLL